MDTGEKIRLLRKAKGLTQEELGSLIGVQKAAINKYETGQVINLKRTTISNLAKALGCSPAYLVDDEDTLSYDEYVQRYVLPDLGPLSPDERALVHHYRSLSDDGKSYLSQQFQIALRMFEEE